MTSHFPDKTTGGGGGGKEYLISNPSILKSTKKTALLFSKLYCINRFRSAKSTEEFQSPKFTYHIT